MQRPSQVDTLQPRRRTVTIMNIVRHGRGTPIVLLHGFEADHRLVLSLESALRAVPGWRRLYPDLPGFGRTPIGDVASTDDVVAEVLDLVDDELAGEQFAILGDSFGGMVARAVAHRRRDRVLGLGLLASVFVADASARVVPERVVLHEDTDAVAVAGDSADDYADIAVVQTRGNAEAFVEFAAPGAELADGEAMKKLSENYRLSWDPEDSEPFTQPSLIITGRQDHIVGYRDALNRLEHYPRATFVTLDEAGHNAHLDQDALVGALVADWLRRMRPYDKR